MSQECSKCGWCPCEKQASQDNPKFICDPMCIECIVVADVPIVDCDCIKTFKKEKNWA